MVFAATTFVVDEADATTYSANEFDGGAGSSSEGWTYDSTSGKLTLDGYNGTGYFNGNFTALEILGTNKITLSTADENVIAAIGGPDAENPAYNLDITGDGTLEIQITGSEDFGISGKAVTINGPTINTNGGNRGIYASGGLTVANSTIDITAVEKSIRVGYGASNTYEFKVGKDASITARVIAGAGNGALEDDKFGIKTGKLNMIGGSVVTDGIHIEDSAEVTGGSFEVSYNPISGGGLVTEYKSGMVVENGITVSGSRTSVVIADGGVVSGAGTVTVTGGAVFDAEIIEIGVDGTIGTSGSNYTYSAGILTLNNYDGKQTFVNDSIATIILIGDNKITLEEKVYAIKSAALGKIYSVEGTGSLAISMSDVGPNGVAIFSGGELEINGVSIDIQMDTESAGVIGVDSVGADIYDAAVSVVIDETPADGTYVTSIGMDSTATIVIRSSDVSVNAGLRALNVNAQNAGITIAASDVYAEAAEIAIRSNNGALAITNASSVDAKISGEDIPVNNIAYAISAQSSVQVASDSTIVADSIILNGGTTADATDPVVSENYATITVNGDLLIRYGAKLVNYSIIENNGTIGVVGELVNASGEIVNNGEINTYRYNAGGTFTLVPEESTPSTTSVETTKTITSVSLSNRTSMADGTVHSMVTVSAGETTTTAYGFIVPTENGFTYYAETESIVVDITYDSTATPAYSVYIDGTVSDEGTTYNLVCPDEFTKHTGAAAMPIDSSKVVGNISVTGGKVTNNGSMSIDSPTEVTIITAGEIVNSGDIAVCSNVKMNGGKVTGNDIPVASGVVITTSKTHLDVGFTFSGEYKYKANATSSEETIAFSDSVAFNGKPNAVMKAAKNNTNTSSFNGYFEISYVGDATVDSKIIVENGSALLSAGSIGKKTVVEALAGTVLQVNKGTTDVIDGVVAVQDGATLNMKVDKDKDTVKYGKLNYVISFANEGYTFYGSLAYALANAAEGATLNLDNNAYITDDTVVKKGITLVFAEKVLLTIGDDEATNPKEVTVSMEEGANFALSTGSSVAFINGAVISGTFTYDGNTVVLDSIEALSIAVVPVTDNNPSNIAVIVQDAIVSGTVTASAGNTKLTATLGSATNTAAKVIVNEGANLDGTALVMTDVKAAIQVDGQMKAVGDIGSAITGAGSIVLADDTSVVFQGTNGQNISVTNGTDVVTLDTVIVNDKNANGTPKTTNTMTVKSVKAGTTTPYMAIAGTFFSGETSISGNAAMDSMTVQSKASVTVPAGSMMTVLNTGVSKADGLVKVAGTINMYIKDDSATTSFGVLNYEITYTDGDYTVYTMVITAVENAEAGDSFELQNGLALAGTEDTPKGMEIPSGVTIIVPEGKKISLGDYAYLIIGDAPETLGATGGIQGTVEIAAATAYVIAFADADMSQTTIIGTATVTDIVDSQVSAENTVLATIYAQKNNTVAFYNENGATAVADKVEPELEGYRFVEWQDTVGKKLSVAADATIDIGDMDFIADLKADMVQVTFTAVEGVVYYVNNVEMNTVGAPVYVEYGSTVVALAATGYTGTALVNGASYIVVDSTTSVITGSGVSEKVTEVVTEPEEDEGLALTDILLIILVVLIVIMAVIVALRMMRS
ncbi:MAG: hypothetical protein IJ026_07850 [Candidatus Methanomethylophilaceae archaeon]|nr:hypothetical protein [Candidatus Methanomethylophilaceae archaeon]